MGEKIVSFIHVIPYDGIGGVEVAARSMRCVNKGKIDYALRYIFSDIVSRKDILLTYNPFKILFTGLSLARSAPDFIVVSLWRSSIVGLIAVLFNRRIRLVTFLHSTAHAHILDYIFTELSLVVSEAVWVDSNETMIRRVPERNRSHCRLISFITRRFHELPPISVRPVFIFWGRLARAKNLSRAIHIFSAIHQLRSDAIFSVIGPDGGVLRELQAQSAALGLGESVKFLGHMSQDEIAKHAAHASFYLQTSDYEGMAMSVTESMQLGLVPVVTPVGEISSYCTHFENAIFIETDQRAIQDVLSLVADDNRYKELRARAISTWVGSMLYRDSVMAACEALA